MQKSLPHSVHNKTTWVQERKFSRLELSSMLQYFPDFFLPLFFSKNVKKICRKISCGASQEIFHIISACSTIYARRVVGVSLCFHFIKSANQTRILVTSDKLHAHTIPPSCFFQPHEQPTKRMGLVFKYFCMSVSSQVDVTYYYYRPTFLVVFCRQDYRIIMIIITSFNLLYIFSDYCIHTPVKNVPCSCFLQ